MRRAIVATTALLMLSACGTDDRASGESPAEYATGELPTADTVQRESDTVERESDVHVASKQEGESEDERAR